MVEGTHASQSSTNQRSSVSLNVPCAPPLFCQKIHKMPNVEVPTLVLLHGMPAVGKLTVAVALMETLRCTFPDQKWCLFHNHMVVDDVLTRHPFGTSDFVRERDEAWRTGLAARLGDPEVVERGGGVVFTFSTENTVPPEFLSWLFDINRSGETRVYSVCLIAPQCVALSRVDSDARKQRMKIQDKEVYARLISEGVFEHPAVPHTDLTLDTSLASPDIVASQITSFLTERCRH